MPVSFSKGVQKPEPSYAAGGDVNGATLTTVFVTSPQR